MPGCANNMDGTLIQRNPAKQSTSATFVFGIIFKQLATSQTFQNVIQSKVFSRHFLMGVNREPNLTGANLFDYSRLDA